MPLFTDAILDDLARFNRENTDATCDVLPGKTTTGGFDDGPAADADPVIEGVRCRVATASSVGMSERVQVGERVTVAPFVVFLDGIVPVTGSMTLAVTYDDDSRHGPTTERFAIVQVESPVSYQVHTVCQCTRAR